MTNPIGRPQGRLRDSPGHGAHAVERAAGASLAARNAACRVTNDWQSRPRPLATSSYRRTAWGERGARPSSRAPLLPAGVRTGWPRPPGERWTGARQRTGGRMDDRDRPGGVVARRATDLWRRADDMRRATVAPDATRNAASRRRTIDGAGLGRHSRIERRACG